MPKNDTYNDSSEGSEPHKTQGTGGNEALERGKKAIEAGNTVAGKEDTSVASKSEQQDAESWRNEG